MSHLGDGLDWFDWVRLVASDCGIYGFTDTEVDVILWNGTAWPFAPVDVLHDQLIELFTGAPP